MKKKIALSVLGLALLAQAEARAPAASKAQAKTVTTTPTPAKKTVPAPVAAPKTDAASLQNEAPLVLTAPSSTPTQRAGVRLSGLLDLAMTRHPTILQARSQAQAAGFDLDAAKWGRFPTVSTDVRSDSQWAQSVARIEQPLWAGGRIDGRIALGEAGVRVAEAGVRDAELHALTQVGNAFFDWLRLDARLASAQQNVQEHQKLLALITRRVKSEISPPADATLAQARLQQAVAERLQIQRQLDTTTQALVQWAGPLNGSPVEPRNIQYARTPSDAAVVQQVLEASAQRHKLQAQIESAQAQIDVAQAQGLPTVVAGYQHILAGPTYGVPDRGRAYVGVQFQPGAGLSAVSAVKSSLAKKDAAEQELQVLERNLESQTRTLCADIDALQAQMAPAKDLLEGTHELVDSYLRQYQIGRKNWLDVLNAQREKSQAQYNLADVRYALQQTKVKLLLLTGEVQAGQLSLIHE